MALTAILLAASCGPGGQATTTAAPPPPPPAPAAPPAPVDWRAAEATIATGELRAHVEELASDAYAGRDTLSEGNRKAAAYLAARFAEYGLEPLPGQSSYLVELTLHERRYDEAATSLSWSRGDLSRALTPGVDFAPLQPTDDHAVRGELVFAGYGRSLPDKGWDDYAGLDVKGKIVLVLRHVPREKEILAREKAEAEEAMRRAASGQPASAGRAAAGARRAAARRIEMADGSFQAKARDAMERGALGMIVVTDPSHERDEAMSLGGTYTVPPAPGKAEEPSVRPASGRRDAARGKGPRQRGKRKGKRARPFVSAMITRAAVEQLLAGTGRTLASLQAAVDGGTRPRDLSLGRVRARLAVKRASEPRAVTTHNVVGFLPGSDPARRDQWVVIGGHYDHVGLGGLDGDTIHNGADDNASGTSAVLEMAQAFASLPPDRRPARSMVFVGFTAEEKGLLGSEAILREGDIPPERVAFMLNLDMIGRNPHRPLHLLGDAYGTGIKELTEAALSGLDVEVEWVGVGTMRDLSSSDHAPFLRRAIPSMFFFTGTHEDYHQVTDHADKVAYERMTALTRLGFRIVGGVADADEAPRFIHQIGWLGAAIVTEEAGGQPRAVIAEVREGTAAQKAGLAVGDEVRAVGKVELAAASRAAVNEAFQAVAPGKKVTLALVRAGQELAVSVERRVPPYLGVLPGAVPADLRARLSLKPGQGLLLAQVVPGGPAEASGLKSGDVLLQMDGQPVNPDALGTVLERHRAGDRVPVVLLRGGAEKRLTVRFGARPAGPR